MSKNTEEIETVEEDTVEENTVEEDTVVLPAPGPVQSIKETLAQRETDANASTPDGMKLIGWMLDGWVSTYPLYDGNARPVYAIKEEQDEAIVAED